jgi:hypothetical protein
MSRKAKDKSKRKGKNGKVDDGAADIARAEKKLAKALASVETAREELALRERELTGLLQRHGRMPLSQADEQVLIDQVQTITPINQDVIVREADPLAPVSDDGSRDGDA